MVKEIDRFRKVEKTTKERRKDLTPLKVYCNSEQRDAIRNNAKRLDMSVSTYLMSIGVSSIKLAVQQDDLELHELLRINGDLGRLGGLIKLWLTNNKRTELIGRNELHDILNKICTTQDILIEAINAYRQSHKF